MGIQMRLSTQTSDSIRSWLQSQFADQPICRIAQLYSLPVASMDVAPEAVALRHGLHRFWRSP